MAVILLPIFKIDHQVVTVFSNLAAILCSALIKEILQRKNYYCIVNRSRDIKYPRGSFYGGPGIGLGQRPKSSKAIILLSQSFVRSVPIQFFKADP